MTTKDAISVIKPIADSSMNVDRIGLFEPKPITTALYMAIEALEKQIPKKPIETKEFIIECCPNCQKYIDDNFRFNDFKFCQFCGQAIDWSDE